MFCIIVLWYKKSLLRNQSLCENHYLLQAAVNLTEYNTVKPLNNGHPGEQNLSAVSEVKMYNYICVGG